LEQLIAIIVVHSGARLKYHSNIIHRLSPFYNPAPE
jgi:hypothetical protein